MAVNYTQDQVEYIKSNYDQEPSKETVQRLANELDKSVKSIIGNRGRIRCSSKKGKSLNY